jgi:hypothetical protein
MKIKIELESNAENFEEEVCRILSTAPDKVFRQIERDGHDISKIDEFDYTLLDDEGNVIGFLILER